MSNSLSDQLLKAGLITQEQITKADQDKQKQKEKTRAKFRKKADAPKPTGKHKPDTRKPAQKPRKQPSDLAAFYNQRNQLEQAERAEEEKQKREQAERRRKTRKQIRELINANLKNEEGADIRYNFVVGDNVKYLFVTEAQQKLIATGELSITFIDGKRCLIPNEVGEQILALDPEKVVIRYTENDEDDIPADAFNEPEQPAAAATPAEQTPETTTESAQQPVQHSESEESTADRPA